MSDRMTADGARSLLDSWVIALEAENHPPNTIGTYAGGVRLYLEWCEAAGREPGLDGAQAPREWLAGLRAAGLTGRTMNSRLNALRRFCAWLVDEGELDGSGPGRLGAAHVDATVPRALTVAQKEAIIRACAGTGFYEVRDAALFSLMFDSLLRSDEAISMTTADISLRERTARVRRGKGGRERWTAFGPQTARLLDRYGRHRAAHPHSSARYLQAPAQAYWLGKQGPISYRGLYIAFKKRCAAAGIEAHPHMLRAGGAVNWRRKGGSTESLLTIAGWKDSKMAVYYTQAAEIELALEEARRLHER